MINKLDNKGMTIVEILVSFILIILITTSIYSMVSSYKDKQRIESFKEEVVTYKNLLTKEINTDLIKKGIISATWDETQKTISINLKTGEIKNIKYDSTYISYGTSGSEIKYPLPNLGTNASGNLDLQVVLGNINCSTSNNILSINIDFYHPELGYRYGIYINSPINYEL